MKHQRMKPWAGWCWIVGTGIAAGVLARLVFFWIYLGVRGVLYFGRASMDPEANKTLPIMILLVLLALAILAVLTSLPFLSVVSTRSARIPKGGSISTAIIVPLATLALLLLVFAPDLTSWS